MPVGSPIRALLRRASPAAWQGSCCGTMVSRIATHSVGTWRGYAARAALSWWWPEMRDWLRGLAPACI